MADHYGGPARDLGVSGVTFLPMMVEEFKFQDFKLASHVTPERERLFDPLENAKAALDAYRLQGTTLWQMEWKLGPEDYATGRVGAIPRALYWLSRRTRRPRPRVWARRLDRRLGGYEARRERQRAFYESLLMPVSWRGVVDVVDVPMPEGWRDELAGEFRIAEASVGWTAAIYRVLRAAEGAALRADVFAATPFTATHLRALWKWTRWEAKHGRIIEP